MLSANILCTKGAHSIAPSRDFLPTPNPTTYSLWCNICVFSESVFSKSVFSECVFSESVFVKSVFLRTVPGLRVIQGLRVYSFVEQASSAKRNLCAHTFFDFTFICISCQPTNVKGRKQLFKCANSYDIAVKINISIWEELYDI